MLRPTILAGVTAVATALLHLPPFSVGAQAEPQLVVRTARTNHTFDLHALRERDQRVAEVGFRLRAANRDTCPILGPVPGWSLHNAAQYSVRVRGQAQADFGLKGDFPSLLVVVTGSPASRAGLRPDDVLMSINEKSLGSLDSVEGVASYETLERAIRLLERELSRPSTLQILRDGQRLQVSISANLGCLIESQVDPSPRLQAEANSERVFITTAMIDFAGTDDELAFVLGHEYAHIILGHTPPVPSRRGTPGATVADSTAADAHELEADQLGLRLAHIAGFDVRAAPCLIARLRSSRLWLNLWSGRSRLLDRRRVELERTADELERQTREPRLMDGVTTPSSL